MSQLDMASTGESVNRFQVLCYEQIHRLHEVMKKNITVHGGGNFPTLTLKLKDLVPLVKKKLKDDGILVKDIRINGGAASYILGLESPVQSYNDLDLIFGLELTGHTDLQKCKNAALNSLLDFLPDDVCMEKMRGEQMHAYVQKMFKVSNGTDRWSLISLTNNKGRNVELKFVHKMKRQFEFSVDSFQILLDSLLTFYDVSEKPMSEHFYPTVVAESMYGNFSDALYHLNKKLIATRRPEQIRGGGLFKYCTLLVHGYTAAADVDINALERYMCSRFFIDFSDLRQQRNQLSNYLTNHFIGEDHLKYDFLNTLHNVINESTICLMAHERGQTLELIQRLATQVYVEREQQAIRKQMAMNQFDKENSSSIKGGLLDDQSNLIFDQVFYHGVNAPIPLPFVAVPIPYTDQYYTYSTYLPSAYTTSQCPSRACPMCPATCLQCS